MIIQRIAMGKKPIRADHPKIEEYARSDEIWSIFEKCWDMDPAARPSADSVAQRLKLMIQELGKKAQGADQKTDTQGKGPTSSDYGRRDPAIQPGKPLQASVPGQNVLGERNNGNAQAPPPLPPKP
jgi:hypothetical protein